MEKIVYESYAFTENEEEKMAINRQIYSELQKKYKILKVSDINHKEPTKEQLEHYDIVYSRKACYAHGEYRIYKCPEEVELCELALICDYENLSLEYI